MRFFSRKEKKEEVPAELMSESAKLELGMF